MEAISEELIVISNHLNAHPVSKKGLPMKIIIYLILHRFLIIGIGVGIFLILFVLKLISLDIGLMMLIGIAIWGLVKYKNFKKDLRVLMNNKKLNPFAKSYKDYCYLFDEQTLVFKEYQGFEKIFIHFNKVNFIHYSCTRVEKTQAPILENKIFFTQRH